DAAKSAAPLNSSIVRRQGNERSMRRVIVPLSLFGGLLVLYFMNSGAPARVSVLVVAFLVLGFLVPAVSASSDLPFSRRIWLSTSGILASFALWDGLGYLVLVKSEPFDLLVGKPYLYLIGLGCMGVLVALSAWLSSAVHSSSDGAP